MLVADVIIAIMYLGLPVTTSTFSRAMWISSWIFPIRALQERRIAISVCWRTCSCCCVVPSIW